MDYEVLPIRPAVPVTKARKHNWAVVLAYFVCVGLIGFVFAISCFVLFISGIVLDFIAFLGLLGVALGSLVWGRVKRVERPAAIKRISGYFKYPVWK
jgi:hypothetical protein